MSIELIYYYKKVIKVFGHIDYDLRKMEFMVNKKTQLIKDGKETKEDIKEVEYWLSNMKY